MVSNSPTRERITIEIAVGILGISARAVQQMALRGQIPGAAKIGRRWTFDEKKLRGFVRQREEEAWQDASERPRLELSGGATSSTRSFRSKAKHIVSASKLTTLKLLRPQSKD
jgi:hypothetical protein